MYEMKPVPAGGRKKPTIINVCGVSILSFFANRVLFLLNLVCKQCQQGEFSSIDRSFVQQQIQTFRLLLNPALQLMEAFLLVKLDSCPCHLKAATLQGAEQILFSLKTAEVFQRIFCLCFCFCFFSFLGSRDDHWQV